MFLASVIGSVILAFLLLIIWIAIAFWPARVAARKGHSFFGFFIPLSLILAYVVADRTRLAT
jgi:hypothetical protein